MEVMSGVKDVLFPNAVGLVLDRLTEVGGVVVAEVHSAKAELRCSDCATPRVGRTAVTGGGSSIPSAGAAWW
jgi:hypothetical protein